jgi:hypothetical protein
MGERIIFAKILGMERRKCLPVERQNIKNCQDQ